MSFDFFSFGAIVVIAPVYIIGMQQLVYGLAKDKRNM